MSMNWEICGEMVAGSMIFATFSTLPFTPIAAPTRLFHLGTFVLSYMILG